MQKYSVLPSVRPSAMYSIHGNRLGIKWEREIQVGTQRDMVVQYFWQGGIPAPDRALRCFIASVLETISDDPQTHSSRHQPRGDPLPTSWNQWELSVQSHQDL